jgi:hypothetical protein
MSKLSELREEFDSLKGEFDALFTDLVTLIDAVFREHQDQGHPEHVRWCPRPGCEVARELDASYER